MGASRGNTFYFIYLVVPFEPLRILLVHYAGYRLRSGFAYGGQKALEALENRRLDVADGELDGQAEKGELRDLQMQMLQKLKRENDEMRAEQACDAALQREPGQDATAEVAEEESSESRRRGVCVAIERQGHPDEMTPDGP